MHEYTYMYTIIRLNEYRIVQIFSLEKTELSRTYTSESGILISKADFYRPMCSVGLLEKVNSSLLWPSRKVSLGTVRQDGPHKAIISNTSEKE